MKEMAFCREKNFSTWTYWYTYSWTNKEYWNRNSKNENSNQEEKQHAKHHVENIKNFDFVHHRATAIKKSQEEYQFCTGMNNNMLT